MISIALLYEATQFDAGDYIFGRSLKAHEALASGSATVDSRSGLKLDNKVVTDITWAAPTDIYAAVTEGGVKRELFVGKFDIHIRRPDLGQYKSERKDDKYGLSEAARYSDPTLDKMAVSLLTKEEMAKFFKDYEQVPSWTTKVENNLLKLTADVGVVKYEFDFDASNWRLVRHVMKTNQIAQSWAIRYRPTKRPLRFSEGPNDYKVAAFEENLPEPKYADKATRQAVAKLFRAYDRPGWLAFEVKDNDGTTKVLMKGRNLRQVTKDSDFSYDGARLAMMDKAGNAFYEGATPSKDLSKALAAADARLDPLAQLLVRGVNPFRHLCSRDATAKIVGSTMVKGEKVTLIDVSTKTDRMNIAMRNSDGRVLTIMTQIRSEGSNMASQRIFTYLPKSEVERAGAFDVQADAGAARKTIKSLVAKA